MHLIDIHQQICKTYITTLLVMKPCRRIVVTKANLIYSSTLVQLISVVILKMILHFFVNIDISLAVKQYK